MNHPENGWHNATELESQEMKKTGWIESSEEERQKIIAAKSGKTQSAPEETEEEHKAKPGRPKRGKP